MPRSAIPKGCRFNTRCPLAFDRCRAEEPPLIDIGNGQSAACWLAEGASGPNGIMDMLQDARRRNVSGPGLASPAAQQLASPAD